MSDVLQNAQMYRHKLTAELAKIEEFLRFGAELSKRSESKASLPLTNPIANSTPAEVRTEKAPRPAIDQAAANQPQAVSAPGKTIRKSLFRGAFEPIESDCLQAVA